MVFYNASTGDTLDIASSFVDTEKSNQGNMVCSLGVSTGISLVSMISFDPKDYSFTLAPQQKLVRKAIVTIPKNMT